MPKWPAPNRANAEMSAPNWRRRKSKTNFIPVVLTKFMKNGLFLADIFGFINMNAHPCSHNFMELHGCDLNTNDGCRCRTIKVCNSSQTVEFHYSNLDDCMKNWTQIQGNETLKRTESADQSPMNKYFQMFPSIFDNMLTS
uniref:Uncharacterized protein n=1 Tax=Romanomermis culicivorax TaxID=13658 RepID=A0A915HVJ2_ROMCU